MNHHRFEPAPHRRTGCWSQPQRPCRPCCDPQRPTQEKLKQCRQLTRYAAWDVVDARSPEAQRAFPWSRKSGQHTRLSSEDRDRLLTAYQIQWSARPRSRGECAGGIPSGLCLACGFRNPERTTAKLSPQAVVYRSAQPAACPSEGSPNLGKDGGLAVLPVHAHRVPCTAQQAGSCRLPRMEHSGHNNL